MKQVLAKPTGINVDEVPAPTVSPTTVLVRTAYTLISTGTEMSALTGPTESLPAKILKDPSLITMGLKSIRERGIRKTIALATGQSSAGLALGYSAAGVVIAVGTEVEDVQIGDRVACAGAGIASHAEFINVPRNLLVKIPDSVSMPEAASVTLGAIAMQGLRQADPKLGETHAVIGLGLLGLLTVQLLRSNGCQVIGIDPSEDRRVLAEKFGAFLTISSEAIDLERQIETATNGHGVDTSIITAATTSNGPLLQSMKITRIKGIVVIVGAVGLELQRSPFYEKEIDLRISRSYGPGRYDPSYELGGLDYPYPYVRWTENRNMASYLDLIGKKQIDFKSMIAKEYPIEQAATAYAELKSAEKKPLAVILSYGDKDGVIAHRLEVNSAPVASEKISVGLIGAGGFALGVHIPNLKKLSALYSLRAVCDKDGVLAKNIAQQNEAVYATTDYMDLVKDPEIDLVMITTRHHLHAPIAMAALEAGKAVFVEKPMAMNAKELMGLKETISKTGRPFFVGFNRRFSPTAMAIKDAVEKRQNPLLVYYRMNAGYLPSNHWVHGQEGGGRIIGEGCHILDLFTYWTGAKPVSVVTSSIHPKTGNMRADDNVTATITYSDGSICTLLYTSLGNAGSSKEYAEVYCDGSTMILDDYKTLQAFGSGPASINVPQDKGHFHELEVMGETLKTKGAVLPISLESLVDTTETSFKIAATL